MNSWSYLTFMAQGFRSSRDLLLVVMAALAFAVSGPLAKSVQVLSPLVVAAGRTFVACLAVCLLCHRALSPSLRLLKKWDWLRLAGAGLLLALHFGLFLFGLSRTSLPAASALISLEPLSVVMVAWGAFRLRPSRREALGVGFATLGGIIVAQGAGEGDHRLLGDVLILAAVLVYGGYVAAARGLQRVLSPLPYAATTYGFATLFLLPFALGSPANEGVVPMSDWGFVLLLGLVPTLIGHTLVQKGARTLSPAILGLVSPGETLGALMLGALFLRVVPSRIEAVGAVVILIGATLAITGKSVERSRESA